MVINSIVIEGLAEDDLAVLARILALVVNSEKFVGRSRRDSSTTFPDNFCPIAVVLRTREAMETAKLFSDIFGSIHLLSQSEDGKNIDVRFNTWTLGCGKMTVTDYTINSDIISYKLTENSE